MVEPNQSLDSRRLAREQEARIASTSMIGFNAIKPLVAFQTSLLRVFSENCEIMALNYEKNVESVGTFIEQHLQQTQTQTHQQ